MEQIEMVRKHKSEDNIEAEGKNMKVEQKWQKVGDKEGAQKLIVKIKDNIDPYLSPELQKQIQADNELHFF